MNKRTKCPQQDRRPHWYILGAGSLGCLWAACLVKDGFECTLILKDQAQLDIFQRQPYIILEKNQQQLHVPVSAILAQDITRPIHYLLVSTKAHHCLAALESLDRHINTQTNLLLMQNGMGIQQEVANRYLSSKIYCGITTDGANCRKAFHVLHAGDGHTQVGPLFAKGKLNDTVAKDATKPLMQKADNISNFLPCSSLSISYTSDIESALWYKLAINCAINGLTALHQCRNGELAKISNARKQIDALCKEIISLTTKLGIKLPNVQASTEQQSADNLKEKVYEVITATTHNRSSMLQDVEKKCQTEIRFINGFLSEQAKCLELHLPSNEKILLDILKLERKFS